MDQFPGTDGYDIQAPLLIPEYDKADFRDVHSYLLQMLDTSKRSLLDIGAGSGRDAFGFASLGYDVTAVEPTDAMREGAMSKEGSDQIEWIKDGLPELEELSDRAFDVVVINAVWMHLDEKERKQAFPRIVSLLRPDGLLSLSLRYGPVPAKRRMFEVSVEEVVKQANECGLVLELCKTGLASKLAKRAIGVTWSRLIFRTA